MPAARLQPQPEDLDGGGARRECADAEGEPLGVRAVLCSLRVALGRAGAFDGGLLSVCSGRSARLRGGDLGAGDDPEAEEQSHDDMRAESLHTRPIGRPFGAKNPQMGDQASLDRAISAVIAPGRVRRPGQAHWRDVGW